MEHSTAEDMGRGWWREHWDRTTNFLEENRLISTKEHKKIVKFFIRKF